MKYRNEFASEDKGMERQINGKSVIYVSHKRFIYLETEVDVNG